MKNWQYCSIMYLLCLIYFRTLMEEPTWTAIIALLAGLGFSIAFTVYLIKEK